MRLLHNSFKQLTQSVSSIRVLSGSELTPSTTGSSLFSASSISELSSSCCKGSGSVVGSGWTRSMSHVEVAIDAVLEIDVEMILRSRWRKIIQKRRTPIMGFDNASVKEPSKKRNETTEMTK